MDYIVRNDDHYVTSQHSAVELSAEIDPVTDDVFISHFLVMEDARGEGHGTNTLNELETFVRDQLETPVSLTIRIRNEGPVVEFLEARGFDGISTEENGLQVQASKQVS